MPSREPASTDSAASDKAGSSRDPDIPNSVDTIVSDMQRMNDAPLAGVPDQVGWAKGPGHVVMGSIPRGSYTPEYWQPANRRFRGDERWKALTPWFVIFDGVDNTDRSRRIEVRDLRVYLKLAGQAQWKLVSDPRIAFDGANYPKHLQGEKTRPPDLRRVRRNGQAWLSVKPPNDHTVFHGWCCGPISIEGLDIEAVYVTVRARLAPADSPADTGRPVYLLHVGADYYPAKNSRANDFAPSAYFPGVGISRAKLITEAWQSFNFATLDVARQEIDSRGSISEADFRASPPPLE